MDVRLTSGRTIRLRELEQTLVYEGVVDGVPTRGRNAKLVAALVDSASCAGRRAVLLPPVEVPIAGMGGVGPDEACRLPRTAVRARFASSDPVSPGAEYSELTVVWFQDAWAPPLDAVVEAQLRRVDWDTHAQDMVW